MTNNITTDILSILEAKLADHGPLQDILGGPEAVAALYSEIDGYLKVKGLDPIRSVSEFTKSVHAISIVSSDGFSSGKDSALTMYSSVKECIDGAYSSYVSLWEESVDVLEDGEELLSKEVFEKELLDFGSVCLQFLDSHVNFDYFEQEITFDRGRGDLLTDIKRQLVNKENKTLYGEPQAWAKLPNGRSIEVTLEQEGLPEREYFCCVRLHCSEAEFDHQDFNGTNGVISYFTSLGTDLSELDNLICLAVIFDENHPVADQSKGKDPLHDRIQAATQAATNLSIGSKSVDSQFLTR